MREYEELVGALARLGLTVSTAESCTGGLIASAFVDNPGASRVFLGGTVAYTEEIKTRRLGVSPALIGAFGVVSTEVAAAMAEGAREAFGSDLAVSTTGVAGPGGGSPETPVGCVCIAVSAKQGTRVFREQLSGSREAVREGAVALAAAHLLAYLSEHYVL